MFPDNFFFFSRSFLLVWLIECRVIGSSLRISKWFAKTVDWLIGPWKRLPDSNIVDNHAIYFHLFCRFFLLKTKTNNFYSAWFPWRISFSFISWLFYACLLTISTVLASQSFLFKKKNSLSSNLEIELIFFLFYFFLSFVFFSHLFFFWFYLHISCGCGIVSSPLPSLVFRHWFASRFKSGSRARQPPQQAVLRFGTPYVIKSYLFPETKKTNN